MVLCGNWLEISLLTYSLSYLNCRKAVPTVLDLFCLVWLLSLSLCLFKWQLVDSHLSEPWEENSALLIKHFRQSGFGDMEMFRPLFQWDCGISGDWLTAPVFEPPSLGQQLYIEQYFVLQYWSSVCVCAHACVCVFHCCQPHCYQQHIFTVKRLQYT